MIGKKFGKIILSFMLAGLFVNPSNSAFAESSKDSKVNLRIAGLSDVHTTLMNHDYFQDIETDNYGMSKIATLIKQAKKEVNPNGKEDEIDNFILVDAGDTIQGNPLGDYYSVINPLESGHPVYKTMEFLKFDVSALGNHEFNYGLDFLRNVVDGTTGVSLICSNVYDMEGKPLYKQYEVINEKVVDENGKEQNLKIGFIGLVPPQILNWDSQHLNGKVQVKDIVESANEMVDVLRNKENVDLIIGLSHSGYGHGDEAKYSENMSYQLTQIEGIDALVVGHAHQEFPSNEQRINSLPNVDLEKGTINNKPTFMAGSLANNLGIIDLKLEKKDGKWSVLDGRSEIRSAKGIENDPETVEFVKEFHENTLNYINQPIGEVDRDLNSFFTLVRDAADQQIVNDAQLDFVKKAIESGVAELEPYKNLPLISISAPFKVGRSAENYIDIKKGSMSIKDVSNLYKYSNTLVVTKLTGEDIQNILELSSSVYNVIDPNNKDEQELINPDFIPFNFNLFDGINYEIDVTKEPRYKPDGEVIDMNNTRVMNITKDGKPISPDEEFLVVTNSYLAGGSLFKSFTPEKLVYNSGQETRQVIADYLKGLKNVEVSQDFNWRIKPIEGEANIVFTSSSRGADYLDSEENKNIKEVSKLENGLSKFSIDVNNAPETVSTSAQVSQEDKVEPVKNNNKFSYIALGIVGIALIVAVVVLMSKKKKDN